MKNIDIPSALGLPSFPSTSSDSISALLWARELVREHLKTAYGVRNSNGIDELRSIKIGGVDQWLQIKGRNKDNPVLLWLHGGPGASIIGSYGSDVILRPWEDFFTIVLWDQRQTGKSYYPADDDNEPLSVDQFIADTEEMIQYLREYLNKDKLFILGASWGTVLGMHMVKRHPDWLHAYVGVGQVVNSIEAERKIYERLISHAKQNNEPELAEKVEALIPCLKYDFPERELSFHKNAMFVRSELSRLAGESMMHHFSAAEAEKMWNFERAISPNLTLSDLSNAILGDDIAIFRAPNRFSREVLDVDLPRDIGSSFHVPIFFFTGSHDWQTPVVLSDDWFEKNRRPLQRTDSLRRIRSCGGRRGAREVSCGVDQQGSPMG